MDRKLGYAFLLPGVIFLIAFLFVPIIYSCYMSLYEWKLFDLGRQRDFVGIENYIRTFSDKLFLNAAGNTLILVFTCLIVEFVLGFGIALSLWNIQRPLKGIHGIVLLPMITSPVIVALIWRLIYDPQFSILNYVLSETLGISNIAWLGDASTALVSVIIVDIWQMTSFVILILYAGMTGIPLDCIEAALVDGASYRKIVRHIILPFSFSAIMLVLVLRTMDLFKIFDTIYVLTRGGPNAATESLSTYIYKVSFQQYQMGYAMALSLITLACILLISIVYTRARKQRD